MICGKALMKKSHIFKAICTVAFAMAFVGVLCGCSGTGAETDGVVPASEANDSEEIAATIGDDYVIYESTVTDYVENTLRAQNGLTTDEEWGTWLVENGYTPETLREAVINTYATRALVQQGAEEAGVTVDSADVDSYIEMMKSYYGDDETWQSALEQAGYTEDEYRSEVELSLLASAFEESFATDEEPTDEEMLSYGEMYAMYYDGAKRSSHILFSADDEETAKDVLDRINSGELDFAEAAQEYSTDTSTAENGGDVGWDAMTSLDEDYQAALDELSKGEISDLVETSYGLHIIKCTDEFNAPDELTSIDQLPSDWVDEIKQTIQSDNAYTAYEAWLSEAADSVVINPMPEGLPYDIDITPYEEEIAADEEDDVDLAVDEDDEGDEVEEDMDEDSDIDEANDAGDSDESDDNATSDDDSSNDNTTQQPAEAR